MYSIIIPTLNEVKLLPSLLVQLNEAKIREEFEYEIIVSDGGSTDGTIKLAEENADKVVVHNKSYKQNISQGRNAGAKAAGGKVLIFFNGDISIPDLKFFFTVIDEEFINSKYLAMTCSVLVSPEESKLSDKIFLGFYNYYFHFLNVIGVGMGRGECHVVKKDVFDKLNGYSENMAAGEDFDLFRRIRRLGKILFKRDIIVYESPRRYRKRGHVHIFFTWLLNSIFVIFGNKSLSNEWEQVR